ncbi:P-loop containing nucleoside triphosphate hydrolase protein [Cadophora sp. DSE1049]|nr:P-loop containing nucleoside triphosphate hydrolase protein [Cadophora sp. DSE1049]
MPGISSSGIPGPEVAEERDTMPDAVHQSNWGSLKRDDKFVLRPECRMDKQILLLVMGAPGVGKKTLLKSLLYGDMHGGAKLEEALLMMEDEVPRYYCDGYIYSLKVVFDTDIEASYPGMFSRYDYFGLILAYDIFSRASLDFLSKLHDEIAQRSITPAITVPTAIFGLKSDTRPENNKHEGCISREQGETLARKLGCHFSECSSKSGHGVYESFGYFVMKARNHEVGMPAAATVGLSDQASGMEEAFGRLLGVGLSDKGT